MSLIAGKIGTFLQWMRSAKPARLFRLMIGVILIFAGLQVLREPTLVFAYHPLTALAERWNQVFHLDIPDLPGSLIGLLAILVGGIISVASMELPDWNKETPDFRLPDLPAVQWDYVWPRLLGSLILFGLLLLQLATHSYSNISLLFWLASLLTLTLLFWKRERGQFVNLRPRLDWRDGVWMLLLFALGIGIGAYLLRDLPAWILPDEGVFWGTARSIAIGEFHPPVFDFGVYSFPIASSIFQAWVMKLVGLDLWGWRFASVLAACLTIFPLYLLGREVFDRRVAIAACVLMIVNPWFLAFARLGYNNSQALFPVVLTIYLLVLGLRRGSYFYLWLAGMVAGLGYYTYFAAWLGLVVVAASTLALPFTARITFRKALPLFLVVLAGWTAIALPRLVFGLSSPLDSLTYYKVLETSFVSGFYGRSIFGDAFINQTAHWSPGHMEIFYSLPGYGILWVRGLLRAIVALFSPWLYNGHFVTAELTGPGASLFFILGSAIALAKPRKISFFTLNAWFWLGLLFLSVFAAFPPRASHAVSLIPVIALLAALGLVVTAEIVTKQIPFLAARRKTWETGTLTFILLVIAVMGCFSYFFKVPRDYAPDFDHTASYLAQKAPSSTIVFIDEVPSLHDADYLKQSQLISNEIIVASRADLRAVPAQIEGRDFMAFIAAGGEGEQIADELIRLLPQADMQRVYKPGGILMGFVVSNIPVRVDPIAPPTNGLRDLWDSPARFFLVACLGAILALLVFGWSRTLTANAQGSKLQTRSFESHFQSPGIEVEFRFRINFPSRTRPDPDAVKEREGDGEI